MNKLFLPVSFWALLLNLIVLFLAVGLLVLHFEKLPPSLPLWFSKPWGAERLSPPIYLWLIPLIILTFLVSNNLLAKVVAGSNRVLSLVLVWGALIISLIILFPLYRIILIAL
jgi:hypothetical protein